MRRLLTIAVVALVPSLAFAGGVHITSHHERHLRVRGDDAHYTLVRARSPLAFEVDGPARVELVVRQAFHPGMRPGRTVTRVVISQDGQPLHTFYVRQPRGGQWHRAPIRGRPSTPRTLDVDVPAGTHRYTLAIGPRHRQLAVAPRIAAPASPLALVPLVALQPGNKPHAEHADKGPTSGGIPLVGLVALQPTKKPHAEHADNSVPTPDAVPLVGLTPPKPHGHPAGASGASKTASATASGSQGAVAMRSGHDVQIEHVAAHGDDTPTAPPVALPEAPPHVRPSGTFVLALRGLVASHGVGGGTIGGGASARMRTHLLDGRVAFGLSVDVVPYALRIAYTTPEGASLTTGGSVQAMPILALAAFTQPLGQGPFSLEATAGVGIVYASATVAGRSGSAIAPGGEVSLGLLFDAGPGSLSLSVRGAGGWGTVAPTSGTDRTAVLSGPLGGLGMSVGYELSL